MSEESKILSDNLRVQHLLEEVSSDSSNITERGTAVLVEHIEHVTFEMLEAARTLASHRKSKEITIEDIQIILAKKMGIEVIGLPRIKHPLYRQQLKSSLTSSSESESKRLQNHNQTTSTAVKVEPSIVKSDKRKVPSEEDYARDRKK